MKNPNKNKTLQWISYLIFILSPIILLILISIFFKKNVFLGRPIYDDEVCYWREVLSFSHCGFNLGYSGMGEFIPKVGNFGTHGFFPSLFYFLFAKICGWPYNGIVISNLIFVIICFIITVFVIKPNTIQTFYLISTYVFYAPILFYAATSMTEMINYGFLCLFGIFLYKYHTSKDKSKLRLYFILAILIGTICSFYRIIYIILLILPIILRKLKTLKLGILSFIWLVYSAFIYYINSLFVAPYHYGILYNVLHSNNLLSAVKLLLHNIKSNFINFFDIKNGEYAEVFLRFLFFALIILYILFAIFKVETKKSKNNFISFSFRKNFEKFYLMQFFLLFMSMLIVIISYDVFSWRDFRTLAPFLWLSLFNIVLFKRRLVSKFLEFILIIFFILNLLFLPKWFTERQSNRYVDIDKKDTTLVNSIIQYDPFVKTPFDNSVYINMFDFSLYFQLQPGIGIEFCGLEPQPPENIKSKYIIYSENYPFKEFEYIGETEFGHLYVKK